MKGAAVIVQQPRPGQNEGSGIQCSQVGARICPAFHCTYQFAVVELVPAHAATKHDIVRITNVLDSDGRQNSGTKTGLYRLPLQCTGFPVIDFPATDIVGESKRFDSSGKCGEGEVGQQKEMDFNGSISSRALQKRMFSHETSIKGSRHKTILLHRPLMLWRILSIRFDWSEAAGFRRRNPARRLFAY